MKNLSNLSQKSKKKQSRKHPFFFAVLQILTLGVWVYIFRRKNELKKFGKAEAVEVEELILGKETAKDFWKDTKKNLKDFFIPHEGNDHRPKALRPKSLALYVVLAVLIKFSSTAFLFILYPSEAEMSRIIGSEIISLANAERKINGIPELRSSSVLTESALRKAKDMFARGYFAHDSPDGKKPWLWIDKGLYDYVYAGENLAMDFTSAELVHRAFMKSAAHKKNILNTKYADIGIAVVNGVLDGRETEILVQFFGTTRADAQKSQTLVAQNPSQNKKQIHGGENFPVPQAAPAQRENVARERGAAGGENVSDESPRKENIVLGTSRGLVSAEGGEGRRVRPESVVFFSNVVIIGFLLALVLLLILNIIIKFHIQHGSLIMQTLVAIAILSLLLISRIHFAQETTLAVLIL